MYNTDEKKINLANIIAQGDMLNHAIFTMKELKDGFRKLQLKNYIIITDNKIKLSDKSVRIKEGCLNSKVGLFSKIDFSLKTLNNQETDLKVCQNISKCPFLNEKSYSQAYDQYIKST